MRAMTRSGFRDLLKLRGIAKEALDALADEWIFEKHFQRMLTTLECVDADHFTVDREDTVPGPDGKPTSDRRNKKRKR